MVMSIFFCLQFTQKRKNRVTWCNNNDITFFKNPFVSKNSTPTRPLYAKTISDGCIWLSKVISINWLSQVLLSWKMNKTLKQKLSISYQWRYILLSIVSSDQENVPSQNMSTMLSMTGLKCVYVPLWKTSVQWLSPLDKISSPKFLVFFVPCQTNQHAKFTNRACDTYKPINKLSLYTRPMKLMLMEIDFFSFTISTQPSIHLIAANSINVTNEDIH